jgi:hypothetical protein
MSSQAAMGSNGSFPQQSAGCVVSVHRVPTTALAWSSCSDSRRYSCRLCCTSSDCHQPPHSHGLCQRYRRRSGTTGDSAAAQFSTGRATILEKRSNDAWRLLGVKLNVAPVVAPNDTTLTSRFRHSPCPRTAPGRTHVRTGRRATRACPSCWIGPAAQASHQQLPHVRRRH